MRLSNFYHRSVLCGRPTDTIAAAAGQMRTAGYGALAIYRGDVLAGIFTERDVLASVADAADPATTPVERYMTADPVVAAPDDESTEVARRMLELGVRHLPVVAEGRLVGMVSARDLLFGEAWTSGAAR